MKSLLITGTDTGVGKTWISCALIRLLAKQGVRVGAYKPVCSGAEPGNDGPIWRDVELLYSACRECRLTLSSGVAAIPDMLTRDLVCPQRFSAAVAPPVAARLEGRIVDRELMLSGISHWQDLADVVVVEGAGGLLCPLTDTDTVADLALHLNCEIVIVAANRLGVINHTLLTLEFAGKRNLPVRAVVLNECSPTDEFGSNTDPATCPADPSRQSNLDTLQQWIGDVPLFHCSNQSDQIIAQNQSARRLRW